MLAQGYRAVPDTLDTRGGKPSVVARNASNREPTQSMLLHANRTGTLDTEIQEAAAKGYRVTGLASDDSGHAALLERAGGGSAATNRVALLGCSRQDTLQKELTEHAVYLVLQTGMLLPPYLVSGR